MVRGWVDTQMHRCMGREWVVDRCVGEWMGGWAGRYMSMDVQRSEITLAVVRED